VCDFNVFSQDRMNIHKNARPTRIDIVERVEALRRQR